MKKIILIIFGLCMVLIAGCYQNSEQSVCMTNCGNQFGCERTFFGLKVECDDNREQEEIMKYCINKCE